MPGNSPDQYSALNASHSVTGCTVRNCFRRDLVDSGHLLVDEAILERQAVDPGGEEGLQRVGRARHDRLAAQVERGVDQHRHAGAPLERVEDAIEIRVLLGRHGLHPAGAVDMRHRRGLLRPQRLVRVEHEGAGLHAERLEPVAIGLLLDDRREGAEFLAEFDLGVEVVLHLGAARVGQDRARAERPRPPLVAAVQDRDDPAGGERVGQLSAMSLHSRYGTLFSDSVALITGSG